jgi:alpha-tubulin suppressor-like RCC1 family protein
MMRFLCVSALVGAALWVAAPAAASPTVTSVDHWGTYFGGQPNDPGTLETPTNITLPGTVREVGTSNSSEYALLSNGTVWAWGQGTRGELGDGGTVDSLTTAFQVEFPAGVTIASIPTDVMPFDTGLAIDTTGRVWGWGFDGGGQLCLGNTNEHNTPVRLPFRGVIAVAGAGNHAFYDVHGKLYACGTGNQNGVLGTGTTTDSSLPVPVDLPPTAFVTEPVASFQNGGALLSTGAYYDWGVDAQGQVGNGSTASVTVPYEVSLGQPVAQVAQGASTVGNGQTIVMLRDGTLRAWGDDADGQLGDGSSGNYQTSPITVSPPAGVVYETIASSGLTSYAISTTGIVYAWGGNALGQVGTGSEVNKVLAPTAVDSGASLISATANNVAVGG